jgi:hypothetical protein
MIHSDAVLSYLESDKRTNLGRDVEYREGVKTHTDRTLTGGIQSMAKVTHFLDIYSEHQFIAKVKSH